MPDFDWEEFLELAEELVQHRGKASAQRTAISRAYYAAFHLASDYFATHGERLTRTGEDHRRVWRWFLRRNDPVSRAIGQNGRRLVDERRRADYDPAPYRNLRNQAEQAIRLAHEVVAALRVLG